ncbi:copper resistance protein CopC [Microbispora cellulosiformans]|uniref:Copper resistance protein CopC n=1 Tax=Microbispora cellulosiformans TaxID=2614688 RepID=A0A5J5K3Z2_9ACTN|nr:copper resistance protein CopC [Microbispora cellulosiformans]KAA9378998.1 copper resistance protein CopC [Microbispora cellulosiformans]
MTGKTARAFPLLGVLCAVLGVFAAPALAHDTLRSSTPVSNAVVSSLDLVELEFNSHVRYPVVLLHDAAGQRFPSGTPRTRGSKVTVDVAQPLPSGSYTVAWRVVAADGSPIEGEIPFTVRSSTAPLPSAPVSSAPVTSVPAPSRTPVSATGETDEQSGLPGWTWAALAGVLVGTGALLMWRRRKPAGRGTPS